MPGSPATPPPAASPGWTGPWPTGRRRRWSSSAATTGCAACRPRATRANLAGILDKLAAAKLPVLLAGMLAPPNLGADYGREFAAMFTDLARERPEVLLYPFFLDGVAGDPALNQPDGIHPNPAGVAIIVGRILPMVETLLDRVPPA